MTREHQPGESVFRSVLPEEIDWKPFAAFPPPARLAVVVGDPAKPGPTLGEQFDREALRAHPPGAVVVLPGDTYHFHWAQAGEYVTQVTGMGPFGLEYRDAGDDPRSHGERPR